MTKTYDPKKARIAIGDRPVEPFHTDPPEARGEVKGACEHGIRHFARDNWLWSQCPYCKSEIRLRPLKPNEQNRFPKG